MPLPHRAALGWAAGLSLVLGACSRDGATATADALTLTPVASVGDTTTDCASAASNPAKVVCLANAFKATLSSTQLATAQIELTQANAIKWSNLPTTAAARNGLRLADLTADQQTAALAVAQAALSAAGYATFQGIRAADTYLANNGGNSTGGPGGGLSYGEGLYYIALLGTPSTTSPWILQLGGHHYALNLSMNGTRTPSPTPFHTAAEPRGTFTVNGVTYAPIEPRRNAMYAMLLSLDATQLASAKLSQSFDDIYLGPGKDGQWPTQQGVLVSSLTSAQQALVKTAIEAWVKDAADAEAADILASYETAASLAQTYVSWSGSTDSLTTGSYIRIDGPRVWIEIAAQGGVVIRNTVHYHTVWRDKAFDYGANFSSFVRSDTVTTGTTTNTAPAINALATDPTSGPFSIAAKSCGGRYTACLRFTVTDVDGSTDAPFKVSINWGDNTSWVPNSVPASTPLVAPHTYAAAGSYTATVTITDARGSSTSQSVALQVTQ